MTKTTVYKRRKKPLGPIGRFQQKAFARYWSWHIVLALFAILAVLMYLGSLIWPCRP